MDPRIARKQREAKAAENLRADKEAKAKASQIERASECSFVHILIFLSDFHQIPIVFIEAEEVHSMLTENTLEILKLLNITLEAHVVNIITLPIK